MPTCCDPSAYRSVFDEANAASDARSYRKKGLDGTARRLVDRVIELGIGGATILEVGGGVGAILLELISAGGARGTNVEIVPSYEGAAQTLIAERGLAGRVQRRVLDFAQDAGSVEAADVVVLHRVVCCYPDVRRLVGAAAERARRILALTFPPDRWWWHLAAGGENLWLRLSTGGFRIYVHDPEVIDATVRAAGLRPVSGHKGLLWQSAIYERAA